MLVIVDVVDTLEHGKLCGVLRKQGAELARMQF